MKVKGLWVVVLMLSCAAFAQTNRYLIISNGQGKGSTAFAKKVGGTQVANLEAIGVVIAESSDPGFAAKAAKLQGVQSVTLDPEIQWINNEKIAAAAEVPVGAMAVNNEPNQAYLWNIPLIGADKTAAAGIRGKGAVVAVLDGGMDLMNPDLRNNINQGLAISFACKTADSCEPVQPAPGFNHGTHVGGTIAAAINGWGVQGVAPEATLVPVKVLGASGSGSFGWLIQGLAYAASIHADVANMSLGAAFPRSPNAICDTDTGEKCGNPASLMSALNRAINYATSAGVLCVSSAGNDSYDLNSQFVSIPAQSGNGMAVAATGPDGLTNFDRLASYSNYGQSVVSIAAPGGDAVNAAYAPLDMVLSDGACNYSKGTCSFYFAAGTSMAAPHVSGVAALIVGQYGHIGPSQLRAILEQTSVDILKPGADIAGKGRVDAWAATH